MIIEGHKEGMKIKFKEYKKNIKPDKCWTGT